MKKKRTENYYIPSTMGLDNISFSCLNIHNYILNSYLFWDLTPCSQFKNNLCCPDTLVHFQWTIRSWIPEDITLQNHHFENPKSYDFSFEDTDMAATTQITKKSTLVQYEIRWWLWWLTNTVLEPEDLSLQTTELKLVEHSSLTIYSSKLFLSINIQHPSSLQVTAIE
jgi:hypothetical protein